MVAREIKRKGVTLTLLWQEYRAAHPHGYGYTWFCDRFGAFQKRTHASFRNRHEAGGVMQTDYAGHTVPLIDPSTGEIHQAQIFVAVLGASSLTFVMASLSQKLQAVARDASSSEGPDCGAASEDDRDGHRCAEGPGAILRL